MIAPAGRAVARRRCACAGGARDALGGYVYFGHYYEGEAFQGTYGCTSTSSGVVLKMHWETSKVMNYEIRYHVMQKASGLLVLTILRGSVNTGHLITFDPRCVGILAQVMSDTRSIKRVCGADQGVWAVSGGEW